MSLNFDVIDIFPIRGWIGAIQNPDTGRVIYNSYIIINKNLLSYNPVDIYVL